MSGESIQERMMAVYQNRVPDETPITLYSRFLPRGAAERELRELGVGIIDYYPLATLMAPPWRLTSEYLSEVKGVDLEVRYSYEDREMFEVRKYSTPVGDIWRKSRKDPAYGSDWIVKHYVDDLEDYKVVQYIVENTVFHSNEDGVRRRISDLGSDGVVWGRLDRSPYQKLLFEIAGPERFLIDLIRNPGPVLELMEVMDHRMDEVANIVLDTSAEVIWQPENLTSDFTPPRAFKEYLLPFYEKLGALVKQAGKQYLVHMDGRLRALKDMIAQTPIDVIESFSYPMIGGDLPFLEAREALPGKVIVPNFPSSLCEQSDEEIERFSKTIIEEIGAAVPYMLQISENLPVGEWKRILPILVRTFKRVH